MKTPMSAPSWPETCLGWELWSEELGHCKRPRTDLQSTLPLGDHGVVVLYGIEHAVLSCKGRECQEVAHEEDVVGLHDDTA